MRRWTICFVIVATLAACISSNFALAQERQLSDVLNVYNWEDYFGETTLQDFEDRYGVKVNLSTFDDESEMISRLQAHPEAFDVIITSGSTINNLAKMRLLAELNLSNIPNLRNIAERFRNPAYDPGHRYSVPYLWGTTGIAYNRTKILEPVTSWQALWDERYAGKVALLNNPEEAIGAALKLLEYPLRTVDPQHWQQAEARLKALKPQLAGFLSTIEIRDQLISGQLWMAQQYSGEALFAGDKNENIAFVIPREGAVLWVDTLAIPRDAKHKYTAEVFINYILDAGVSASIANYLWYANCNEAARAYTEQEILDSPSLYPPEHVRHLCESFYGETNEQTRRLRRQWENKLWSELSRPW